MNSLFEIGFYKTLYVLRDYLSEIIIAGGWAPFIYYRYLLGNMSHEPVLTQDIDFVVKTELPVIGAKTVDQLLLEAGLRSEFITRDNPPIIHYKGAIEGTDVEIEFLTDQTGSNTANVMRVQEGLNAEALRYISIIIDNVIEVNVDAPALKDAKFPMKVKVPTPAAYIFQKGLIFRRRRDREKGAKDLYYIFDILTGCIPLKKGIMEEFALFAAKYGPWYRTFLNNLDTFFNGPGSEGVLLTSDQRPAGAFTGMDDDQLKLYIYGMFAEFIANLKGL